MSENRPCAGGLSEAAELLVEQRLRPTVTRVRAALGGGSPNDLLPALRAWRDSKTVPASAQLTSAMAPGLPVQVAELFLELWRRVSVAALMQAKGGTETLGELTEKATVEALRAQVNELRGALDRELLNFGTLQAQSARHETSARSLASQAEESENRARRALRDLGFARSRIAELKATLEQVESRAIVQRQPPKRSRKAPATNRRSNVKIGAKKTPTPTHNRPNVLAKPKRARTRRKLRSRPR